MLNATPPTPSSDWPQWVTALVSAIAGFVTGAGVEFLRAWWESRRAVRIARDSIYWELGELYYSFVVLGAENTSKYRELAMKVLRTDSFDYYYRKKPSVFYKIQNWYFVRAMYWRVKGIQADHDAGKIDADSAVNQIAGEFQYRFDAKVLDETRIRRHAQDIRDTVSEAMTRVYKKSTE